MSAQILSITAMVTPLQNPPNRIREQRTKRGVTLQDLADKLNTSKTQISRFETGEREIDLRWMRRIAHAMGLTVGDILNNDDVPASLDDRERHVLDAMRESEVIASTVERVAESLREYQAEPAPERKRA